MLHGKLEVLLICARGLEDNMDPYVILTCRSQEQKSSVAKGAGSEPEWNETFVFTVSDDTPQLIVTIMDSDALTDDDFVGEATIPLEPVLQEGSLAPEVHRVVKDEQYCGEITPSLQGMTKMELTPAGIDPVGKITSTKGNFTQELLRYTTLFGIVMN